MFVIIIIIIIMIWHGLLYVIGTNIVRTGQVDSTKNVLPSQQRMLSSSFYIVRVILCPALKKIPCVKKIGPPAKKKRKGSTISFGGGGGLRNLPTPTGPNRPPLSPKPPFLS
jgi:hypothetical protein